MGDEAGRMTAEPCAGCGCKWKRCKPDTPGSNTGVVVCAYCGTFQSRYEFTVLPAAPVGGDEGQTDLPDAVVEAAAEVIHREVTWATGDDSKRIACAVLAAASGPWAEQLDAANAYTNEMIESANRIIERTKADLAAALARNAELQAALDGRGASQEFIKRFAEAEFERLESENTALRAELDNLRDRVNALAEATPHKTTDHLGNVTGYLINADELAALVRGSDDE